MGNGNPAEPERIILLRPGALGDVLAARGALAWLKRRFPAHELVLLAPGERGRFLARRGLADRAHDWDAAAFAWLFTDGATPPPGALAAALSGARLIAAFVNFPDEAMSEARAFSARLRDAAAGAEVCVFGAMPPDGERENIATWLLARVRDAAERAFPASGDGNGSDLQPPEPSATPRISVAAEAGLPPGPYAVLHPGSGGARKNWPLVNYAFLGRKLLSHGMSVVVTAGPADGSLGAELCRALPGARLVSSPPLAQLAAVLAGAVLYVGNDSGVSHLAAAVERPDGRFPAVFVIFGPTDAAVWAPPGSNVLPAGRDFSLLDGAAVWDVVREVVWKVVPGGDGNAHKVQQ